MKMEIREQPKDYHIVRDGYMGMIRVSVQGGATFITPTGGKAEFTVEQVRELLEFMESVAR